ncbi:MAG: methyltransferase domain-containing protein [Desulfomonile tiedjei]|uniref:Methyltransferase domain-containing protein n=1 Tax=Desulfomonile tiedjei TaxID=2358 RepID=A0A9D6V160_9BACT|nr:methyltransferase domain-containing protein [Desulfomonile tiedjei]
MNIDPNAREQARLQWNTTPCGRVEGDDHTLEYFLDIERERYAQQTWMHGIVPFGEYCGKNVLEVGCGHGTDLAQFGGHGAECFAIDITERHLELTRRNFALRGLRVDARECDATAICFANSTFDCVYSFGVVHHIPEPAQVLDEVHRVLKPGGAFFIGVYNKWSIFHVFSKLLAQGILRRDLFRIGYKGLLATIECGADGVNIKPYVKLYSTRELLAMLGRAGFSVVRHGTVQLEPGHFSRLAGVAARHWDVFKKCEQRFGWYVWALAQKQGAV